MGGIWSRLSLRCGNDLGWFVRSHYVHSHKLSHWQNGAEIVAGGEGFAASTIKPQQVMSEDGAISLLGIPTHGHTVWPIGLDCAAVGAHDAIHMVRARDARLRRVLGRGHGHAGGEQQD